jgi:hypothetical protein
MLDLKGEFLFGDAKGDYLLHFGVSARFVQSLPPSISAAEATPLAEAIL